MREFAWSAVAFMALGSPVAASQALMKEEEVASTQPMRIEGMAPWGSVVRVMPPEYPKELIARKGKVYVDITGKVSHAGALVDPEFTPGSEEAQLLVQPLKDVVKHWHFQSTVDDDCQPTRVVVKNRAMFDFDGEKPAMRVVGMRDPKDPKVEATASLFKTTKRTQPYYPYLMNKLGWQANVFAKITVDPKGDVVGVQAVAYPKQRNIDLTDFEDSTKETLKEWKFVPAPELKRNRHGCYTILFRLRG